jgi:hypothetical protein
VLIAAAACGREETLDQPQAPAELPPGATATVEQVDEDPMRFYGKRVTLGGEVEKIYGARAFELQGENIWWDEQILVVTRSPVAIGKQMLTSDEDVLVSGTIRKLTVAEVERELGWDLEPEIEVEFAEKPVLVADSIRVYDAQAMWSEKEHPDGAIVGLMRLWTAPDLVQLAGQTITVHDVPVRSKTGKAMWIGYNHMSQILVVPNSPTALEDIDEGERVTLSGTLEKMPNAELAREMWNLPKAMDAQIAQEPLYINATRMQEATKAEMSMNLP